MHILQLGPYPPPEGGISRNMLAIRGEVLAGGGRCSIIATSRSSRIDKDESVYHPRSAFDLLKLLSSINFDVLHLHIGGEIGPRVLALALVSTIFGRGKSVLTLHSGGYPQTARAMAAKRGSVRGYIFRRFSQVIAVSEPIADVFLRYGLAPERVHVIQPYALAEPDEKVVVPKHLTDFCEGHSPLLVAVGGLEKDYDPLLQIEAMRDILADFPQAGLMIVGDGSMRKEAETAVAASGYKDSVCIAGNVEHGVTLHLINRAAAVLRTTLFDGDAISIREALFLGTPVIATDIGTRPEGVHLIGIGDKTGLVGKVSEVAGPGRPKQLVAKADTANIGAVVELYQRLLS